MIGSFLQFSDPRHHVVEVLEEEYGDWTASGSATAATMSSNVQTSGVASALASAFDVATRRTTKVSDASKVKFVLLEEIPIVTAAAAAGV